MACKNYTTTLLVEEEETVGQAILEINSCCKNNERLAVDCEGVNLSRDGELTILTIATQDKVYIFDVFKIGRSIFDKGLRDILEKKSFEKLTFDCREDSDALWHKFNVKLSGVLDLQLLEVIHRWNTESKSEAIETKQTTRRSQLVDDVDDIYGYRRCIEVYIKDEEMMKSKTKGSKLLDVDQQIWKRRPISDDLIEYCTVDTHGLFVLWDKLKDEDVFPRLRIASEKYADIWRSLPSRSMNRFEHNAFLPLDIIPQKEKIGFPFATTFCTTCHRKFPQEEFSKNQLRKRDQKCRVCKKVKLRDDVQKNREDNLERDAYRNDYYNEYDSSDSENFFSHYEFGYCYDSDPYEFSYTINSDYSDNSW